MVDLKDKIFFELHFYSLVILKASLPFIWYRFSSSANYNIAMEIYEGNVIIRTNETSMATTADTVFIEI